MGCIFKCCSCSRRDEDMESITPDVRHASLQGLSVFREGFRRALKEREFHKEKPFTDGSDPIWEEAHEDGKRAFAKVAELQRRAWAEDRENKNRKSGAEDAVAAARKDLIDNAYADAYRKIIRAHDLLSVAMMFDGISDSEIEERHDEFIRVVNKHFEKWLKYSEQTKR